jgi:hypothetical protein
MPDRSGNKATKEAFEKEAAEHEAAIKAAHATYVEAHYQSSLSQRLSSAGLTPVMTPKVASEVQTAARKEWNVAYEAAFDFAEDVESSYPEIRARVQATYEAYHP